jgi:hypothetical protein
MLNPLYTVTILLFSFDIFFYHFIYKDKAYGKQDNF